MKFNKIEIETWSRYKSYKHFSKDVPCTYSMTLNLNISNLKSEIEKHQLKLFPTILYGISRVVNAHSEFRMDLDKLGNIGFYENSNPYYTIFNKESETFTNVWTEYHSDFDIFYQNYNKDIQENLNNANDSKPLPDKNIFNVSCIPWTSFTGFNLNMQNGYDYFLPIFTIGKYFTSEKEILLPLALQVHHGVCDGFHIARFANELQEWGDEFLV